MMWVIEKPLHVDFGKGATLVPGTVKLLHPKKDEMYIYVYVYEDFCRIGLELEPDERW